MSRLALASIIFCALSALAYAGPEQFSGKEVKQVAPAPCEEWYGDREWNVAIWGAYGFGADDNHTDSIPSLLVGESHTLDDLLGEDGAWGGGMDIKYFFHRYFGIGVEGFVLHAERDVTLEEARFAFTPDDDLIGAVKGTLTLRYPFHCSRFAPYIYAGGGVLFSERQRVTNLPNRDLTRTDEDDPIACGQVGGGLEVRIIRHVGWIGDVSWNFTEHENFGMVRSGINFAF